LHFCSIFDVSIEQPTKNPRLSTGAFFLQPTIALTLKQDA